MDEERFGLLVNILRVIEKQRPPNNVQNLIDIVDSCSEDLTTDQKSQVLKHILSTTRKDQERNEHFLRAEEDERLRQVGRSDYFF